VCGLLQQCLAKLGAMHVLHTWLMLLHVSIVLQCYMLQHTLVPCCPVLFTCRSSIGIIG
jgi:hypothetical protein